jgi:hypothetical protein
MLHLDAPRWDQGWTITKLTNATKDENQMDELNVMSKHMAKWTRLILKNNIII